MPSLTWNKRWARDLARFRSTDGHYGDRWGDPSLSGVRLLWRKLRHDERSPGNLAKVVKRYLRPYVTKDGTVLEIGPGGGRWTQFLMDAREVVLVELNSEFFPYLQERFGNRNTKLRPYQTSGFELEGIESGSIDFVFSFGTFVHISPDGIDQYLGEIRRVLRPGGTATIQYADRSKKFFANAAVEGYHGFSDMDGPKMESLLHKHAFEIVAHDRSALKHSNVVVFRAPGAGHPV
jgi:SAM-dependent methyltransferase